MKRAIARNRPLYVAVAVSTLFHLSMVSIFSIVIWFPRGNIHYALLEIAQLTPDTTQQTASAKPLIRRNVLRVSPPDQPVTDASEGFLVPESEGAAPEDMWAELPEIELPRLSATTSDPLRSPEERIRIRGTFSDLFEPPPEPDSWARFSLELRQMGSAFGEWTLRQIGQEPPRKIVPIRARVKGFDMHIEWISEPKDRALLFLPPIQALWQMEPSQLPQPLRIMFTVDPQGKVVDVQYPVEDDEGVASDARLALLEARFAPLQDPQTGNQRGTMVVSAESESE